MRAKYILITKSTYYILHLGIVKHSSCCAYGADGAGTQGYDCLIIPGNLRVLLW